MARSRTSSPRRGAARNGRPVRPRETAETLARRQREISVSEFFTKNRHLLGFDNPRKALLTAVKEAVDNSLDACEEAGIVPDLRVEIHPAETEGRYRLVVEDNGPGIVRTQIPRIFGQLLYGSKFHTLKQARGQQGIGISAAGMYGQLTTGKPVIILSRTGPRRPALRFAIAVDTARNRPRVLGEETVTWDRPHGTRVEIELEGRYLRGRQSVDEYLKQTSIANPHVDLRYRAPDGSEYHFPRVTRTLPPPGTEIKPHPYGVELGALMGMLRETRARSLTAFLRQDFSRVGPKVAAEICTRAGLKPTTHPGRLGREAAERLINAIRSVRILAPPADCIVPIGQELILKSLKQEIPAAEFYTALTRAPSVYRGNPFQVEVGLAYGGELPGDELARVLRFANRVPLLYQQGACLITRTLIQTDWKLYGLAQARGAPPTGPLVVLVHIASVWVPFTSESKEAVADYPEIQREIRLALQECGRRLRVFVNRRRREADARKKRSYIEKYIPHIGKALQEILGMSEGSRTATVNRLKEILARSRKL